MAGSKKKKGSAKKGSNKKKKQQVVVPKREQSVSETKVGSSDDEDFKDDEPEKDLDLVDPSKQFKGHDTQDGFQEQEDHDTMMFQDEKFFRTEVKLPEVSGTDTGNEAFCVAFNDTASLVATGCGDGAIRVYNAGGKITATLTSKQQDLPTTCARFRPPLLLSGTKNVLLTGNANGVVSHWHVMSKTEIFTTIEEDNQIYAVEYRPDGEHFLTAGRDATIRIYDEATKTQHITLASGRTAGTTGHSNRVYSVKYVPGSSDILVSGGWDNTVLVWDVRAGHCVRSIYGPHICGDGIDIDPTGKQIITASWRPDNALEIWDLGSSNLIRNVAWQKKVEGKSRPEMLYGVKWSTDGSFIVAGGAGTCDARVFETKTYKAIDRVQVLPKGVYAVGVSDDSRHIAVAGASTTFTILDRC